MNTNPNAVGSTKIDSNNPFAALANQQRRTGDLCDRIIRFANAVLGQEPGADTVGERAGSRFGGLVGAIETEVESANERLSDAEYALARLEQVMGPF